MLNFSLLNFATTLRSLRLKGATLSGTSNLLSMLAQYKRKVDAK